MGNKDFTIKELLEQGYVTINTNTEGKISGINFSIEYSEEREELLDYVLNVVYQIRQEKKEK